MEEQAQDGGLWYDTDNVGEVDVTQMLRELVAAQSLPELFEAIERKREKLERIVNCTTQQLHSLRDESLSLLWVCGVIVLKELDHRVEARRLNR